MSLLPSFLRFFFGHLYHDLAGFYDLVAWTVSLGAWKDWVLTAERFAEGEEVLEIGPGTGHLQAALIEAGKAPVGIDESQQMLRRTSRRIRAAGARARLVRGRAEALPFTPACFDTVLSTFPAEYILDQQTLAEVWRILRPGGLFIVVPWALRVETRWLFEATHQGPSTGIAGLPEALARYGFATESRLERGKNGTVAVILARKPASL